MASSAPRWPYQFRENRDAALMRLKQIERYLDRLQNEVRTAQENLDSKRGLNPHIQRGCVNEIERLSLKIGEARAEAKAELAGVAQEPTPGPAEQYLDNAVKVRQAAMLDDLIELSQAPNMTVKTLALVLKHERMRLNGYATRPTIEERIPANR